MTPRMMCVLLLVLFTSSSANAQSRARERALDVTVGAGAAMRGDYNSSTAPAGDVLFSVPVGQRWRGGVSFSAQAGLAINDCIARTPGGPCVAPQPFVLAWSALFGREWRTSRGSALRVFAGPSLVQQLQQGTSIKTPMGGATGRIDLVSAKAVNVLLSIRTTLAPALLQQARGTVAVGLGVGFH